MKVRSIETLHRGVRHLRKDGGSVFIDVRAQAIGGGGGGGRFRSKSCRFAMGIDVTEREQLQQQLDHQAETRSFGN